MKKKKIIKNPTAKALRTPTFRPRIVQSKKRYIRKKIKMEYINSYTYLSKYMLKLRLL